MPDVSDVRITTLILRTCNFTTIACDRWSLVTNQDVVGAMLFKNLPSFVISSPDYGQVNQKICFNLNDMPHCKLLI